MDLNEKHTQVEFVEMDLLKIFAPTTLEMFTKLAFLHPANVVLQNCDELFTMEHGFYYPKSADSKFPSAVLFVIKPIHLHSGLSQIFISGQAFNLAFCSTEENYAKILNGSTDRPSFVYQTNLLPLENNKLNLEAAKIVGYSAYNAKDISAQEDPTIPHNLKEILNELWISQHDVEGNFNSNVGLLNHEILGEDISYNKDAIAIVGQSCRFPQANSVGEFWELLKSGGDGIRPLPLDRLEIMPDRCSDYCGFLKCPIKEFDANFFEISPREAELIDPQQRLLLEVAWEALENAAINPQSLKGSNTGVFTGIWENKYDDHIRNSVSTKAFHNIILGNTFSATSDRISHFLGLNGPNIATESGCSSSLVSLHLACESLKRKETNMALVMGANLLLGTESMKEFSILARDGHCKTFDEKADGFGRAEGIVVIVVKRLSDAIENGDNVIGIVRGTALSNEGTSSSFGTPSKYCQEIAIREALRKSNVAPDDVDYIEAHGTGTPVGDPVEFGALSAAYAGNRLKPLVVGSVKTNIGHTESAAGLAGIIKVLLSMEHEIIPQHRNFETLNPNINLESLPAILPLSNLPWLRNPDRPRIAGVNSFGISGTNVHAIIEEPPLLKEVSCLEDTLQKDESSHILTLSAKSEIALDAVVDRFAKYLRDSPENDIEDFTYTANSCRAHFKYRTFVTGKDISELKCGLEEHDFVQPVLKQKAKIAFLFTGQGSQYVGMAHRLYNSNAVFRTTFDECLFIIKEQIGTDLREHLWEITQEKCSLQESVVTQLSIFSVQYSLARVLHSFGIKPDFVLGHSIGEYAAAVIAEIMNLQDALNLLICRSQLIAKLPVGGMMAINCSEENGRELISAFIENNENIWIDLAVINSTEEVVVAGNDKCLEKFHDFCKNKNIRTKLLNVSHPFHSRGINDILEPFGETAITVKFKNSVCNYVSGMTGCISFKECVATSEYWQRHARDTVNFRKGILTLAENGCNTFIEVGPNSTLLALGMSNLAGTDNVLWLPMLQQKRDDCNVLLKTLGMLYTNGVNIIWSSETEKRRRKKLDLPKYPFQRQKYWVNTPVRSDRTCVHPFLGKQISLASSKEIIYSTKLNLMNFPYLEDHKVGNLVIMPGAGFLEITLAAGRDILSKGAECVELEIVNFQIERAFQLEVRKEYEIQIVALPLENNSDSILISVYVYDNLNSYDDGEAMWKKYSSVLISNSKENSTNHEYIQETIGTFKTRCKTQFSAIDFYKEIEERGIQFGETFQSIESILSLENETFVNIPVNSLFENSQKYVYHPVILDAMFQSLAIAMKSEGNALFLPIAIDNCIAFSKSFSDVVFAHSQWDTAKNAGNVNLYNDRYDLLIALTGVRFSRTTIASFISQINGQNNLIPNLYQEKWRSCASPVKDRLELKKITPIKNIIKSLETLMENYTELIEVTNIKGIEKFIGLRLIKIFHEMEFFPKVGVKYDTRRILQDNLVAFNHTKLFDRFIDMLSEDGYLVKRNDGCELVRAFPDVMDIDGKIEKLRSAGVKDKVLFDIVEKCLDNILRVFEGKVTPVSALFGREDMNILDMYTKSKNSIMANIRMANFIFLALESSCSASNHAVRIIEIGGGSAASSIEILKLLQKNGIPFQYTFTDISNQFFENARKELSLYSGVEYKTLDIEKDPSAQGFCPHYYDIVIAAQVVHATENLQDSIRNIRKLLANEGMIMLQEILNPSRITDVVFGILDSYWRFKDYHLRKSQPMVPKVVWDKILAENGFESSFLLSHPNEFTCVLVAKAISFSETCSMHKIMPINVMPVCLTFCDSDVMYSNIKTKLSAINWATTVCVAPKRNYSSKNTFLESNFVNMTDFSVMKRDMSELIGTRKISCIIYLLPLDYATDCNQDLYKFGLNFCKYVSECVDFTTKLLFVTKGAVFIKNQKTVHPSEAVIWGMAKSLMNEIPNALIKLIDLDPDIRDTNKDTDQILFEIFDTENKMMCYRNGRKFKPVFSELEKCLPQLNVPKGKYRIETPKARNIEDLNIIPFSSSSLNSSEVEIMVKAISLNFRDVFKIMKPEGIKFSSDGGVGSDFAGIVTTVGPGVTKFKVGDEVFGFADGTAASHIILEEKLLQFKPRFINFCEASTIPSACLTSYHCLVTVANLKRNETVLIHVASGGVGLYAIQIAKNIGAKIIATAGSWRKREYLRSIGIIHVFHSRDLSFGEGFAKVTNGIGVNVVLNSLTGPGFKEQTLQSVAQGGRFIEIGKLNIWGTEDVKTLRPDVYYKVIDLEKLYSPLLMTDFVRKVCQDDFIKPIPYMRFDISNIKNAVQYFMRAEHIGKIVLAFPQILTPDKRLLINDRIFNGNGTYLQARIQGGGLGAEAPPKFLKKRKFFIEIPKIFRASRELALFRIYFSLSPTMMIFLDTCLHI